MDDRGEKIVTLAREMLRAEVPPSPERDDTPHISFKLLCIATLLTALSSSAVTAWAYEIRRPINRYERVELNALVFYAARMKGLSEETLRLEVQDHTGAGSFDDMTQYDYTLARDYLRGKIR